MENVQITVGMPATINGFSDRYPATVISVHERPKFFIVGVQEDTYKVVKGYVNDGSAEYEYERNPNGRVEMFKVFKEKNEVHQLTTSDTGRLVKCGVGGLTVGARRRYYDPHF